MTKVDIEASDANPLGLGDLVTLKARKSETAIRCTPGYYLKGVRCVDGEIRYELWKR